MGHIARASPPLTITPFNSSSILGNFKALRASLVFPFFAADILQFNYTEIPSLPTGSGWEKKIAACATNTSRRN